MNPRHRDGLLAIVGVSILLVGSAVSVGLGPLVDPLAVVGGVVAAVLVEVAFLRYPGLLLSLWDRRGVPTTSLLVVVALGAAAVRYAPVAVGALVWGLATYLVLLGCVLSGVGNPLGVVARTGGEE